MQDRDGLGDPPAGETRCFHQGANGAVAGPVISEQALEADIEPFLRRRDLRVFGAHDAWDRCIKAEIHLRMALFELIHFPFSLYVAVCLLTRPVGPKKQEDTPPLCLQRVFRRHSPLLARELEHISIGGQPMRTSRSAAGAHPAHAIPLDDKEATRHPVPGKINDRTLFDPAFEEIDVRRRRDNAHTLLVV